MKVLVLGAGGAMAGVVNVDELTRHRVDRSGRECYSERQTQ